MTPSGELDISFDFQGEFQLTFYLSRSWIPRLPAMALELAEIQDGFNPSREQ